MPSDYILPIGQNQGFNPTIYHNVGPGLVGYQTYAPAGSFLRVDGNWAVPGSESAGIQAENTNFAVTAANGGYYYNVTTGSSAVLVTLPSASTLPSGFSVTVRKADSGSGVITFTPTMSPAAQSLSTQGEVMRVFTDATNWYGTLDVGTTDASGNFTLSAASVTIPSATTFSKGTASTSTTTGSVLVTGGVGATGAVNAASLSAGGSLTSGTPTWTAQHLYNDTAVVAQAPIAATRTYLTGSAIGPFTAGTLAVGTVFRWKFDATKTGAGTAASTIDIAVGTAGTTGDGATISFTKPAGTAAVDEAWFDIEVVVKTLSATVGVISGVMRMVHNLSATGHAQIPVVVVQNTYSTLNTTTPTYFGVCITTGASDAITINQVTAEAINL